jgi:cytochrome c551/c552
MTLPQKHFLIGCSVVFLAMSGARAFAADGAALFQEKICNTCHGEAGKQPVLPVYPKLAGQIAPADRQRGAQQVHRLIRLEIGPVDKGQGRGDARQQHPAQCCVERPPLALKLAVAEQAVGSLDAVAQTRLRLEPSPDIGQRQAGTADARGDRRE